MAKRFWEQVKIDFATNFDRVALDKEAYPELQVLQNTQDVGARSDYDFDWFGEFGIIMWDPKNPANSLYFTACILSFCTSFGRGLQGILSGKKQKAHVFGSGKARYFVTIRILDERLLLQSGDHQCEYEIDEFVEVFSTFVRRVLRFLPMIYRGLEGSQTLLNAQNQLEYWLD